MPAAQEQQPAADNGYQWKQVFLPEGTRLRASFGRAQQKAVIARLFGVTEAPQA